MSSVPSLLLETALVIAQGARDAARGLGLPGISVVILDIDGVTRMALREDSQGAFGIDIATAKARTALGFRRSTTALSAIFTDAAMVTGLTSVLDGRLLLVPGGIVIQDGDARMLGAAGVAGGTPAMDDEIACAAVRSAGLQVAP